MDHLTLKQMQGAELCLCCTGVARLRGRPIPIACLSLITLILAWRLMSRKVFWVSCMPGDDAGHHYGYTEMAKSEMAKSEMTHPYYRVIPARGCPKAPLHEA